VTDPVGVFLPSTSGGGAPGRAFQAPGAPALPRALEIARALRPLAQRVPGRTRYVLDEARTINRLAEEGLCDPVLRPAPERWLKLSLVIDTGDGSDLWKDVARELRALLGALGAFRDVRTWSLDVGRCPLRFAPGLWSAAGVTRDPKGLIDPTGRTLTVVLSPCIASGWHDGGAAGALGTLAARGPVVLVPLLPEYLWPRTALASAVPVTVTSPNPGTPNRFLVASRPDAWPGEEAPVGVTLPVAVLEPASLRRWAALVAGRPGAEVHGFVLESHPAPDAEPVSPAPASLTAAERVAQFRQTASPLARRLAGLLAAAPVINLPIVRLVRESLLPQAGQPHEAEVLFGGLLTRSTDGGADPRFEFLPDTRPLLVGATPTDLSVRVLEAVSEYLGEHLSSGRTFRAVLADPAAAAGELEADASPFARIAADVLLRAGGDYARIVRSLPRKQKRPSGVQTVRGTVVAHAPPALESPRADAFPPDLIAELEANTEVPPEPLTSQRPRRVERRFRLPPNRAERLGREESKMEIAIPEDQMISRFQAVLTWEPTKGTLTVQTRPAIPPVYPDPPPNKTWVFDKTQKKVVAVPDGKCVIGTGESFWIGQTRFTLRPTNERYRESPEDAQLVTKERTRAQLEEIPYDNPAQVFRALEQLQTTIRTATGGQGQFRQMLKVVMDAVPRADAAAIVRIPPDNPPGEQRLNLVELNVRSELSYWQNEFWPSKELSYRAILETRRSCLQVLTSDPYDDFRYPQDNFDSWAVCTPFQDGSRSALYVAGKSTWDEQWDRMAKPAQDKIVKDLTQYQKIAELLVGMIETTLRVSRLTHQNKVIRRAWPRSLWKYLDDADELERMLAPKEMEITTLFCNLWNYSLFASQRASDMLGAQREVSTALSTMSGAITDRDGVVAGFREDAVLGFWGWPELHEKQVELAARAALAIQGRLNSWQQAGRCGLGITHGTAVVGRLSAHDLAVLDVFGPVVNLTFALEEMTRVFGVPIIVSQEIADRIAAADPGGREMRTRPLGKVRAKGFPEPLWAHELYSAHSPSIHDYQLADWTAVVDLFTAGNWTDASDILATQFADDPVAKCLMRVMDKTRRKTPNDWDGSFIPPGS
jgi:hypothetical protein